MTIKQVSQGGVTQQYAVYDTLGNELFKGSYVDAQAYYDANKQKVLEDAYTVDGNLVNAKRVQVPAIKLNEGWKDLKAKFSVAAQGANAPAIVDLPNGVRIRRFGVNDSMHVEYHVDHDLILATRAFPHFHIFTDTDVQIGQTITWEFIYIGAKGYTQGGNFLAPRTTIQLTFTADKIIPAGDHIIIEGSEEIEGLDLLEPDTQFLCEAKYTGGTFTGNMYGIQSDIHYKSDHETTIGKRPDFNQPDI